MGDRHSLYGPHQDELAYPVHHMVPETTSQNQVFEPSNATMIPQMTLAADLTHSEDLLSLKPGQAMGDNHSHSGPHQDDLVYPAHHMGPKTPSRNQGSELSKLLQ